MTNINLGEVITNPTIRKAIYTVYVLALVIVGATTVGFASVEGVGIPNWLTITTQVLAYLGVPVSSLALINTPSKEDVEELENI